MERQILPARAAGALVVLLCTGSLVGWTLDVDVARRLFPELVPMNPVTAVALLAGSLAVLSLRPGEAGPWRCGFVRGCGCCLALVGAVRLGDHFFATRVGIDQVLYPAKLLAYGGPAANRMAPVTALDLIAIGAALALADAEAAARTRPTAVLAWAALALGALPIVSFLWRIGGGGERAFPFLRTLATCSLAVTVLLLPRAPGHAAPGPAA